MCHVSQVNWGALWMTFRERDLRSWLVTPLITALILIPVGLFSGTVLRCGWVGERAGRWWQAGAGRSKSRMEV